MIALAKAGFARRSQSAGGHGNPPRVPIIIEERVGVEPTVPCGTHDFQSCPFGHSGISPFLKRTLGGSFKSPATNAVKQSLPSLTRILRRTLGGSFKSPATSAVGQSPPSLTRMLFGFCGEERVGVEPTLPFGKPDFESGAFGHSAISPIGRQRMPRTRQKVKPLKGQGTPRQVGRSQSPRTAR